MPPFKECSPHHMKRRQNRCMDAKSGSPLWQHHIRKPMPPDRAFSPLTAQIFLASVDKGTRGFSRGKTPSGCVILVGGRQPTCLVCLASRRLSSAKNSEGLAGAAGALPARQRTQACWRKSRTITPQAAFQPRPQACVSLSTDAWMRTAHPILPFDITRLPGKRNDFCVFSEVRNLS